MEQGVNVEMFPHNSTSGFLGAIVLLGIKVAALLFLYFVLVRPFLVSALALAAQVNQMIGALSALPVSLPSLPVFPF